MRLESSIVANADVDTLFKLGSAVEAWPEILPHYRTVRVIQERDGIRLLRMSAWRGLIPVAWEAIQEVRNEVPLIRFVHTRGATKGMEVEWRFLSLSLDSSRPRTKVTILHERRRGGLGRRAEDWLIGGFFIDHIASKTLGRMKELSESSS